MEKVSGPSAFWEAATARSFIKVCRIGRLLVHASQKFLFLRRKMAVAPCFDFPLAGKRRHLAQSTHRALHLRPNRLMHRRILLCGRMRHPVAARCSCYPVDRNNRRTRVLLARVSRGGTVIWSSRYAVNGKYWSTGVIVAIVTWGIVRRSSSGGRARRIVPGIWI